MKNLNPFHLLAHQQLLKNHLVALSIFVLLVFFPSVCSGQWISQNSNTTTDLFGLHFPDAANGWAVGADGFIAKTSDSGANWSSQSSQTIRTRDGIFMLDATDGFAVGDRAIVSSTTYTGTSTWNTLQITGFNGVFLHDVYFPTSTVGYISANNGKVFKTSNGGMSWDNVSPSPSVVTRFRGIHFIDTNTGWIVGTGGYIRKTTNGGNDNWPVQMSQGGVQFHGVDFIDASTGWVVGLDGIIKKTIDGGANWNSQTSGVTSLLKAVDFIDADNGWIVGSEGIILRTENGGTTWYRQPADVSVDLHDVQAFSDQVAIAVGVNGTILKTTNGGGFLPVELAYFSAKFDQKKNVLLNWQTANEQNNEGFEVQWSRNGEDWRKLAFIKGSGDTQLRIDYSFVHSSPSIGANYYRLKQLDYDGTYSFSTFEVVNIGTKEVRFQVYPNPVENNEIFVSMKGGGIEPANYRLLSIDGVLLQQGSLSFNGQDPMRIILNELKSGTCILQLLSDDTIVAAHIFIK